MQMTDGDADHWHGFGGWVDELQFSEKTLSELRSFGLSDALIEQLRKGLEMARHMDREARKEKPATVGEVRKELQAIARAADALADAMYGASESTRAALEGICHKRLGDYRRAQALAIDARAVAGGCRLKAADLNSKKADPYPQAVQAVRVIAEVARSARITVSAATNSKFRRLCVVALNAINVHGDPRRAIERVKQG